MDDVNWRIRNATASKIIPKRPLHRHFKGNLSFSKGLNVHTIECHAITSRSKEISRGARVQRERLRCGQLRGASACSGTERKGGHFLH